MYLMIALLWLSNIVPVAHEIIDLSSVQGVLTSLSLHYLELRIHSSAHALFLRLCNMVLMQISICSRLATIIIKVEIYPIIDTLIGYSYCFNRMECCFVRVSVCLVAIWDLLYFLYTWDSHYPCIILLYRERWSLAPMVSLSWTLLKWSLKYHRILINVQATTKDDRRSVIPKALHHFSGYPSLSLFVFCVRNYLELLFEHVVLSESWAMVYIFIVAFL